MAQLRELWQTTVPGDVANSYLGDASSNSLFVSDGWGVAYAALRLHRLELATGRHLADLRTRHQSASAMALHRGLLYAATDSRLFELRVADLGVVREWNKNLVRYTQQLVPAGEYLVAANWRAPSVGVFDLHSGRTRRLKIGQQLLIFHHGDQIKVIAGFDGGMWDLDLGRVALTNHQATPAVTSVGIGQQIWATLAGPREGGDGEPPVWTKRGMQTIVRLTGGRWSGQASGSITQLVCDDRRGVLWCLVGQSKGLRLEAVSQTNGVVIASFEPPAGFGIGFCHVDPEAGIALRAESQHITKGNILVSSSSTVVCYALPVELDQRG